MKKTDLNEIAKIEKAIKEKYGEEAIQNPKNKWDKEKEKKYLKSLERVYSKKLNNSHQIESREGFILKDRTNFENPKSTCPVCSKFSLLSKDDLYMTKFECCFQCFVQYVEGREERWKTGWRPNN